MTQGGGDLSANYAKAFDGKLEFGKRPALLIVDFVMAYLDSASPLYAGVEDALECNIRLLAAVRQAGIPVIFTNVVYEPGGADGGLFYQKTPALKAFDRGSPLGQFPPTLQPREGEAVISKQFASAFFGTALVRPPPVETVSVSRFCETVMSRAAGTSKFAPPALMKASVRPPR